MPGMFVCVGAAVESGISLTGSHATQINNNTSQECQRKRENCDVFCFSSYKHRPYPSDYNTNL